MTFLLPFDWTVLIALTSHQTYGWIIAAIIVSELGRATTIALLTLALALYLGLKRHFILMQGLVLAVATSGIMTFLLKGAVARPRPPMQYWAYHEIWWSFPSAHSALSMAFYGFVAYIALRTTHSKSLRILALTFAAALILIIGFTRLYLGVHYLSDVLGGYLLGATCVWLGIWAARSLERGSMSA